MHRFYNQQAILFVGAWSCTALISSHNLTIGMWITVRSREWEASGGIQAVHGSAVGLFLRRDEQFIFAHYRISTVYLSV